MEDFIEKWKNDKKFKSGIKLILYGIFVIFVAVYAINVRTNNNPAPEERDETEEKTTNTINIPPTYHYDININIDDNIHRYYGDVLLDEETLTKESNGTTTNYICKDNAYYYQENDQYIITPEDAVYDVIDSSFIKLDRINTYLTNATKINNNQYQVYLKDILLENDTNDYIIIEIDNNKIDIDYTTLMKSIGKEADKCLVTITIEE